MMKEIMKHVVVKLLYYVGWFIDNILLTIFNFAFCIPMSYLIWVDGSYWSPIQRKVITNFSFFPLPFEHNLVLSISSMLLICIVVGAILGGCDVSEKVGMPIAIACALTLPTISFIVRFCMASVKLYRRTKAGQ